MALYLPANNDPLLAWANDPVKRLPVHLLFTNADDGTTLETLVLAGAYCVGYREEFAAGDGQDGAYRCFLTLADPDGFTLQAGGPSAAYVAPAAGTHGGPGVALIGAAITTALPFIVGADGVPRLPRITGAPPFTIKGATTVTRRNGTVVTKPGLDRDEYLRQLTGQETGLNKLTVAQFLANRDAYDNRKKTSKRKNPDGRDPKGDAAQKVAREDALQNKVFGWS